METLCFKNEDEDKEAPLSDLLAIERLIPVRWEESDITCPVCKKLMRKGSVDIEMSDYLIIIHNLTVYHCPDCRKTVISNQARKKISKTMKQIEEMEGSISALW